MRRIGAYILAAALLAGMIFRAAAAGAPAALGQAAQEAAAWLIETGPAPSADDVWAVLGLARSGTAVPEGYFEGFYRAAAAHAQSADDAPDGTRHTAYSRLVLGLTAAGYDPEAALGGQVFALLGDLDRALVQGINGPIFALLALDCGGYPAARRDDFVAAILARQLDGGGWNLTGGLSADTRGQAGDPDVTAMALQALAKYTHRPDVEAAAGRAVAYLSRVQQDDGGYASWGSQALESAAQVLLALCELGIAPDDPRFVKQNGTLVGYILGQQNADGSFRHTPDGDSGNRMATEQAFYSLVAAVRLAEGACSLYRMDDAPRRPAPPPLAGLPGKHPDVTAPPPPSRETDFSDIAGLPEAEAIANLAARGIVNGKAPGLFDPQAPVTRAEFAAMLTRALGLPAAPAAPFADVPEGMWYARAVDTAYHYGIVSGLSETAFGPGGPISRQEAAVMLARAAALCGADTARNAGQIRDVLAPFDDYRTAPAWSAEALAFCVENELLDAAALVLAPGRTVVRGQAAYMIDRLLAIANLL